MSPPAAASVVVSASSTTPRPPGVKGMAVISRAKANAASTSAQLTSASETPMLRSAYIAHHSGVSRHPRRQVSNAAPAATAAEIHAASGSDGFRRIPSSDLHRHHGSSVSPEYMASYARKFVQHGVKIVGGCCGSTPEHIRVMKAAMRVGGARSKTAAAQVIGSQPPPPAAPAIPLEERSRLGAKIAAGEFVTMVEIVPPKGTDIRKEVEGARFLKSIGVDGINIPDSPRASARMSNQALSLLIQKEVGIEAILHYTCRDRNVLCIQSDLLGAAATGIRNLICITGDPPKMGNYPDATAVFDVDAIGLVNIVHNLNRGLDIGGNPIGHGTAFVIGVGANPGVPNIDEEIRRFEYKVEAGAEYAVTQPVFDLALMENFLNLIEHCRIPVIAGLWPLVSVRNAEFMRNELRVSVPDSILERMGRAANPEAARAEGVAIAREMLVALRDLVQGAQISAPLGRYTSAVDVLEALGSTRPAASV